MADKMAGGYRYVKKDGDSVSRVILKAGDDVPKDLDKATVKDLKERGLIVDAKRLSSDGQRLPYGHPDSEDATPQAQSGDDNKADDNKGAKS